MKLRDEATGLYRFGLALGLQPPDDPTVELLEGALSFLDESLPDNQLNGLLSLIHISEPTRPY